MPTGGELLVRTLARAGVRQVFGLHGAHLETLFQAMRDHGIALLDTRHEVAAGHAAEGYARAMPALGVAMITAGPGFTNVVTSIANAYLDRTPVLYIAGSAALRDAETNTLQAGIDQVAVARPITKWAHRINVADQIPRLTALAIRTALAEPAGPVLLDMPMDVLTAQVADDAVHVPGTIQVPGSERPGTEAIREAMQMLRSATRPVIMAGAGVWMSGAGDHLKAFAEATGIPVFTDFQAHGLLPPDHPLLGGTFHKLSDLEDPGARPDVVLVLGVRFGLFTLGASDLLVPGDARIIHVETDAREIGRLRDVDIGLVCDSRSALDALLAEARSQEQPDRRAWQSKVRDAKRRRRAGLDKELARNAPPIHPYQAVSTVVQHLPGNSLVIGDGAEAYHWLNEVIAQDQPGSYLTHGFLGAVGFGMGLALGAQAAHPKRRVLCLAGDGAVGFTIAEFDTFARHALPVVVVVMNNRSWGASQHFQEIVSGPARLTGTQLGNARYDKVAEGFGCHGQYVERIEELGPALDAAFASGKPACINVVVDVAPIPPEVGLLMRRH